MHHGFSRRGQQFIRHSFIANPHDIFQKIAVFAVHPQEVFHQIRGVINRRPHFTGVNLAFAKERVFQDIAQIIKGFVVNIIDQILPINAVGFQKPHQHPNRKAALVVFHQINVSGADP